MHRTPRIAVFLAVAVVAPWTVLVAPPAALGEIIDRPTVVHLAVAPGPETAIGTELTLTATVSHDPGPTVDRGLVVFIDGGEEVGRAEVGSTGSAAVTYTPPTIGRHELRAEYAGAPPDFDPARSEIVAHTVIGDAPLVPEIGLLLSPPDRAPAGTAIRLHADVEGAIEDPRIRGTVVFRAGDVAIATAPIVVDDDTASVAAQATLPPGVHRLSARYLGNLPAIGPSTSAVATYSVLPATCADQAWPGNAALVRLAYLAVLDRCPDPAGFAYWTDRLDAGTTGSALGRGLALSSEGVDATVEAAYHQVLDRPADAAGRAVWAAKLRAGWTTSQLWAALAASPEFVGGAAGPDPTAALVARAYQRIVGRPVDAAGAAYWQGRLSSSASRWGAMRALALTSEALGHVVDDAFVAVLGRPATAGEQGASQTAVKDRRGDWRTLAADLLGRPAAVGHSQTYPDPAG